MIEGHVPNHYAISACHYKCVHNSCELDVAYLCSSQQALSANSRAGQNFIARKEEFLVYLHPHVSQVLVSSRGLSNNKDNILTCTTLVNWLHHILEAGEKDKNLIA